MYPPRQHFALLKPIADSEWDQLPAHLTGLFSKATLVEQELMTEHETLEFETSSVQRGGSLWAFFTVAVSGCSPIDRLLSALVAGFERSTYVIGKPGSGFGKQPGGTVVA